MLKRLSNSLWFGNAEGRPLVRPAVRLCMATVFWALIIAAIAINGVIWPPTGTWPLALVATAMGLVTLVGAGLILLPSLRSRLLLPGTASKELVGRLPIPVLVCASLFAFLLFQALDAGGEDPGEARLTTANARCAVIFAQMAGFTNKPDNKQSYMRDLEIHAALGAALSGPVEFRRAFDQAAARLRADLESFSDRDAKLKYLMNVVDDCASVSGKGLRVLDELRNGARRAR